MSKRYVICNRRVAVNIDSYRERITLFSPAHVCMHARTYARIPTRIPAGRILYSRRVESNDRVTTRGILNRSRVVTWMLCIYANELLMAHERSAQDTQETDIL